MLLNPEESRALYEHANLNNYAILAVNADSSAAITDCLVAAERCDAPIIIETSLWQLTGHSFGVGDPLLGMDRYLADLEALANCERFKNVPVIYHTDHIKGTRTFEILSHAMKSYASSISLDSSEMSAEENIATIAKLCDFAEEHDLGATLEMEAGVDDGVTSMDEARLLFGSVEKANPGYLALWAPGVGTQHGLASDPASFSAAAVSDHRKLASDIAGRPIGIALHGSSGLSNDQLMEAVVAGVTKVNWSSQSLLIRSAAARAYFVQHGEELEKTHANFKGTAMDNGCQTFVSHAYVPHVVERINTLGGNGFGSKFL